MRRATPELPFRAAAMSVGLVWMSAATAVRSQAPVFSSRTAAMTVDVSVTTKAGDVVAGLTAADFRVFDNGAPQKVQLVLAESLPLNLVVALDTSSSVSGEALDRLRDGCLAAVGNLRPGDRARFFTFSQRVIDHGTVSAAGQPGRIAALEGLRAGGRTSLIDGAFSAMAAAELPGVRSVLLIFSDGTDTASWLSPDGVLEAAKRLNVTVYAVTMSTRYDAFLKDLSGATGGAVIIIRSLEQLSSTFTSVLDQFRRRYVLLYSPEIDAVRGYHSIGVKVARRDVVVRARRGYTAR